MPVHGVKGDGYVNAQQRRRWPCNDCMDLKNSEVLTAKVWGQ